LINTVLTVAPEFGESGVITPLNAILDWMMGYVSWGGGVPRSAI
jgi:hypothetical protein